MHSNTLIAGRSCRTNYFYSPEDIALADESYTDTLYVIGGLYGNTEALDSIFELSFKESTTPTLCFNGDFNWFNRDITSFEYINNAVLQHDATLGNVEIELFSHDNTVGCGCAYPEGVSSDIVERSNAIHLLLKKTAKKSPSVLKKLEKLPLFKRYSINNCHIGVVHGDAYSLAGWSFDQASLRGFLSPIENENKKKIYRAVSQANVSIFASSHTCLPALLRSREQKKEFVIINNGSAGMPNFYQSCVGLITRISSFPSPFPSLYGVQLQKLFVDAIAVPYNSKVWQQEFLANWPKGSSAYLSYFDRIAKGTSYPLSDALIQRT